MDSPFKYIYGPVYSWRIGRSLGIDPLSAVDKICNMNCVYCQLGLTTHLSHTRKEYVKSEDIIAEIKRVPLDAVDYLTFSGRGEPTLAKNLGQMIHLIKAQRLGRVAVITNSVLMHQKEVRLDLSQADFVLAKLDAFDQESFQSVNGKELNFEKMLGGIREFRQDFKGKFALQIMLIEDNLDDVCELAALARDLNPDEIQLNTPLRPCPVKPIERAEMDWAKKFFGDEKVVTVWDSQRQDYKPLDPEATIRRHGNYLKP
ncbi:MAG: radical SAM protein [Candidatus Omnitrophica bacterium]|nr:radical SAM protein [Candidatus Omnitrophota bacterium]